MNNTYQPGFLAEIWTRSRPITEPGFIGRIEAVDEHGIRLRLFNIEDWEFTAFDMVIPHREVLESSLCTGDDSEARLNRFINAIETREARRETKREHQKTKSGIYIEDAPA